MRWNILAKAHKGSGASEIGVKGRGLVGVRCAVNDGWVCAVLCVSVWVTVM